MKDYFKLETENRTLRRERAMLLVGFCLMLMAFATVSVIALKQSTQVEYWKAQATDYAVEASIWENKYNLKK